RRGRRADCDHPCRQAGGEARAGVPGEARQAQARRLGGQDADAHRRGVGGDGQGNRTALRGEQDLPRRRRSLDWRLRLLLDTQVLLWALLTPDRLLATSREAIEDGVNEIFVSIAS